MKELETPPLVRKILPFRQMIKSYAHNTVKRFMIINRSKPLSAVEDLRTASGHIDCIEDTRLVRGKKNDDAL